MTNILYGIMSREQCQEAFSDFIRNYTPDACIDTPPLYLTQIKDMTEKDLVDSTFILNVNMLDVYHYNAQLYESIIKAPRQVIALLDQTLESIFDEIHPDYDYTVQVRLFNLRETTPMRDLGPEHIGTLVSVQGMISRVSHIIPQMYTAYFECSVCQYPKVFLFI